MKVEVGQVVKTHWDDSDSPIKGRILKKYRGHRGVKYLVRLQDGTNEVITEDQVIGVVNV